MAACPITRSPRPCWRACATDAPSRSRAPSTRAGRADGPPLRAQGPFTTGRAVPRALPLAEFNAAYSGPPTDPKVFEAAQKKLQEELAPRAAAARARAQQNPSGQNPPGDIVAAARPPEPATPAPTSPRPAAVPFGRRVALVIGN